MSILGMLKRRNFELLSSNGTERLVFPKFYPKRSKEKLLALLHSYGFRTVLKDAILHKDGFTVKDLTHYCSEETARLYLKELILLKLAKKRKDGSCQMVRSKEIFSLGDTLEWFLADLLNEELECDALWNVTLSGLPSGGDFDVLADFENHLLYIEVKSSPPKSIEAENITSFLNRVNDLRPDMALFFEDTTLRMKDKILPIFEDELARRFKDIGHLLTPRFEQIHDETYRYGSLFITNSKPGVLENLRQCLAVFLQDRGIRLSQGII
jgi:hypothetical protein